MRACANPAPAIPPCPAPCLILPAPLCHPALPAPVSSCTASPCAHPACTACSYDYGESYVTHNLGGVCYCGADCCKFKPGRAAAAAAAGEGEQEQEREQQGEEEVMEQCEEEDRMQD